MTARFHNELGVARSLRQIVESELGRALATAGDKTRSEAEVAHGVRLNLKRVRALIRLPQGHFPDFERENRAYRDLGRLLARARDAEVLGETYDGLVQRARIVPSTALRATLVASGPAGSVAPRKARAGAELAEGLAEARRRARHWRFGARGFALIGGGLRASYDRMREAEAAAAEDPTAANLHEWRKQVKYHAGQLKLLQDIAPDVLKGYRKVASRLADVLGRHHDLDVLRLALEALPESEAVGRDDVLRAIGAANLRLEAEAFRLGFELTAEQPADFLRRIETWWNSWRK